MCTRSFMSLFSRIPHYYRHSIKLTTQRSCLILTSRSFSQWDIVGAVCLERKPVISQPLTPLEQRYYEYIQKLEVEKSYLSDHEKRCIQDKKIAEKIKAGTLEDMDLVAKQTAQDFEDACLEEFNKYKPAPRVTDADIKNDKHSIERKLDSSLIFVINEKLGNEFKWMLPQAIHKEGETLRQTAERALDQVAMCHAKIRFMGNAPVGYYKYKYPKAVRGNGICGAKVFFFKAQVLNPKKDCIEIKKSDEISDYMWLTHAELEEYLVPVLHRTVESFLFPDTFVVENTSQQTEDEEQLSSKAVNQC